MKARQFCNLGDCYNNLLLIHIWQLRRRGFGGFVLIIYKKKKLKSILHCGLMDVVYMGDTDPTKVRKTFIHPSSHLASSKYRV